MKYYHGSNKANLNHLKPFVSEHEKAYVYFSTNPVLAALYCVHVLERPLNWFPYGLMEREEWSMRSIMRMHSWMFMQVKKDIYMCVKIFKVIILQE